MAERATCVLTTGSAIYCWGRGESSTGSCTSTATGANSYCGELGFAVTGSWGNGTNLMSALPAVNLSLGVGEAPIDVAAGRRHVCVIVAVSPATSGTPKCWGYNSNGQLGRDSATTAFTTPSNVLSITTATELTLLGRSSCAILASGASKCWGRGSSGQLLSGGTTALGDNGGEMAALANMNFGTGRTVKKISGGYYFGCAILDNNFMKCWGSSNCDGGTTRFGCHLTGNTTNTNYGGSGGTSGDNLRYLNH